MRSGYFRTEKFLMQVTRVEEVKFKNSNAVLKVEFITESNCGCRRHWYIYISLQNKTSFTPICMYRILCIRHVDRMMCFPPVSG